MVQHPRYMKRRCTDLAYTLITSERSPFGRICRLLMIAHKIDFNLRILNFVDDREDAKLLAKETPINKVPILVLEDGQKIFDSRVIVRYLTESHNLPRLSLALENFVSAIYSCLDTSVMLFLMKKDGFDLDKPGFFMKRNWDRIANNLAYAMPMVEKFDPANPADWNYASMSLYSYLDWAEHRAKFLDVQSYPRLHAFMTKFSDRPGVQQTSSPT